MISYRKQLRILHSYTQKQLAYYHRQLTMRLETAKGREYKKAKVETRDFHSLLYVRNFLRGCLTLADQTLADIFSNISHGERLLKDLSYRLRGKRAQYATMIGALKLMLTPKTEPNRARHGHGRTPGFEKRILHISDLHFGEKHKYLASRFEGIPVEERPSLLNDLVSDLKRQGLFDKINFVVVTGDLTWDGETRDFSAAREFLEALLKVLGLKKKHLVVVPGNHDIKWGDYTKRKDASVGEAEQPYRSFYELLYRRKANKYLSHFAQDEKVGIVGLNSSRLEPTSHGIGFIGRNQLSEVLSRSGKNRSQRKVWIAAFHHHLVPVKQMETVPKPFDTHISVTLDAEGIIKEMIQNGLLLALHGHQHQPFFGAERRISEDNAMSSRQIFVFGCGTLSGSQDLTPPFGRNHYNILKISNGAIEVSSRCSDSGGNGFQTHFEFEEVGI
jgi:predicted MPP superfamily phosphohydrolase